MVAVSGDLGVDDEQLASYRGLFLRTYRHLYEDEKRTEAAKLEALVRRDRENEGVKEAR
jgi:hypothetical protein